MRHNLLFLSAEPNLIERLQLALTGDCAVMALDPRSETVESLAARFSPAAIVIDAGANTGARTVLERISAIRAQFPGLPLLALGDEMSAQLILAAFRAGVDDFLDRDASDGEIRGALLTRLAARTDTSGGGRLIGVLSPMPSELDGDLALNIASLIAAGDKSRVLLLDLTWPATAAKTALGLECDFTIAAAIRHQTRLDQDFLDSALARAPGTGLYVLPLSGGDLDAARPGVNEVAVLLPLLRSLFDAVVVCWDALSHDAAEAGIAGDILFVGCNQRFSSVRAAKLFLARPGLDAILAVHQLDANLVPSASDIVESIGARKSLILRASWGQLALAHNRGKPQALGAPSPYGDALRTRLAEDGLLPVQAGDNVSIRLTRWLNRARA